MLMHTLFHLVDHWDERPSYCTQAHDLMPRIDKFDSLLSVSSIRSEYRRVYISKWAWHYA